MSDDPLHKYLAEFDTYGHAVYYYFHLGSGGIADCLKFFVHVLQKCIDKKCRLYYVRNQIPIEKYVRVRYPKMLVDKVPDDSARVTQSRFVFGEGLPFNRNTIVDPTLFYKEFDFDRLTIPFSDIFEFSREVTLRGAQMMITNEALGAGFVAMHLRLGDKFLETDPRYVACKLDQRTFDLMRILQYIEDNGSTPILFLCDNARYRDYIRTKFANVFITGAKIGHTSFVNTTEEQVLDTVAEFYVMTLASKIVMASYSGFSQAAAKFNNVPIEKIYTE